MQEQIMELLPNGPAEDSADVLLTRLQLLKVQPFYTFLNDEGKEGYSTIATAVEAMKCGEEMDIQAFKADDWLLTVLGKFQWLCKHVPDGVGHNAGKAVFGAIAWAQKLKAAKQKEKENTLQPVDLDDLHVFAHLADDKQQEALSGMSQALIDSVQGTAKKKARRSNTSSSGSKKDVKNEEADHVLAMFG